MIRAFVGAGGKTTWIRRYIKKYLDQGKKVFVTTSTHMYVESDTLLSDDADEIIRELENRHYVMAGIPEGKKIRALSPDTYEKVCRYADEVLIEADGSRHLPLKYPNAQEPVIYDNVEEIIIVCGMHALYEKASEAIHRFELAKKCLGISGDTQIEPTHIQKLIRKGYIEPLREKYPEKNIIIKTNGSQSLYQQAVADLLEADMDVSLGRKKIGCVIMASGLAKRFGRNKLVAEFQGKTMIERVLDITGEDLFFQRVVVTRSEEVRDLCTRKHVNVIFHAMPNRNDTIHLGTEVMKEMDGCLFCPCDQPLLKKESLQRMIDQFEKIGKGMYRLSYGEKQGTPILFGKEYFQELLTLPSKSGGSYLVKKYPNQVEKVSALDEMELFDIDTPEEYDWMLLKYK